VAGIWFKVRVVNIWEPTLDKLNLYGQAIDMVVVSIILTAGSRTEFLSQSLASVASQDERDLDQCELIVVSTVGLTESQILERHPLLRRIGRIKVVKPLTNTIGEVFASGIAEASGDVLAFLNDDDLWEPAKLSFVRREFRNHQGLGYLKHGASIIDDRGRPVSGRRLDHFLHPSRLKSSGLYIAPTELRRNLPRLGRLNADFNDSTIAISRSALVPKLQLLRRLERNEDTFFFLMALVGRLSILVSPLELTRYRVHSGNSSLVGRPPDSERFTRLVDYNRSLAASIREMRRSLEETNETYPWGALLEREERFLNLLSATLSLTRRRDIIHPWGSMLPYVSIFKLRVNLAVLALATSGLISPSLVAKIYSGSH
jgi:glycosyltransferase involved in cell wall biosynthesis